MLLLTKTPAVGYKIYFLGCKTIKLFSIVHIEKSDRSDISEYTHAHGFQEYRISGLGSLCIEVCWQIGKVILHRQIFNYNAAV